MCATFAISTMKHYCEGEEDTLRLLKAGISVVEVAEAGKPRVFRPMGISADHSHYLNKEIKHYIHSDLLISWENEEYHAYIWTQSTGHFY